MSAGWSELVSAALVGTDRRPFTAATAPKLIAHRDGPAGLLAAAAMAGLRSRAGLVAVQGVQPPVAAPPEAGRVASPAAATTLARLLTERELNDRPALLAEWFTVAASRGLLAPPSLLPFLLDHGQRSVELRALIAACAGERGRWLAAQRPDWGWLVEDDGVAPAEPDQSTWSAGDPAERLALLRALRRRDPAAVRHLVQQEWPAEPPEQRAAMLRTLTAGLSLDDEPLLDAALDDRARAVRKVAADLLASLPGSALAGRMTARVLAAASLVGNELRITLPDEYDEEMLRFGIERKPPPGVGERAWWFEQIVSRAPLGAWTRFSAEPSGLLRLPVADDLAGPLHRGWVEATVRQRDPRWALALAEHAAATGDETIAPGVFELVPPAEAQRLAIRGLTEGRAYASMLLPACPRPWPEALSLAALVHMTRRRVHGGLIVRTLLDHAMQGMSVEFLDRLRGTIGQTEDPYLSGVLERLATAIAFRQQIHQELT
jgi:hypothetical protein